MQFNPSTEYNSIVKNISDLTGASLNNYTLAQRARSCNNYLNRAYAILLENSDKKNWDDPNFTTLPQGTYDIISGDRKVTMEDDEEGKQIIKIRRVIIKSEDQTDTWSEVVPMDLTSDDYVLDDSVTGVPQAYDWVGNTLIWDITPNYNKTGGVKVFYQRASDYFNESDTTKEPGLPEHLHDYLVYGAAYDYAMTKGLKRATGLQNHVQQLEKNMREFASNQSIEKNTTLKPLHVNVK